MTRLTPEMIGDTPNVGKLDARLMGQIGTGTLGIAEGAAGLKRGSIDICSFSAAVVPITSGLGVISGFSESVNAAVRNLGMRSFVTAGTDVAGFAEAVSSGAAIVFMADDDEFVAYNVKAGSYTDNTTATACGYISALRIAAGGTLCGKDVLAVGCGRVGSVAASVLSKECRNVYVTDICCEKAEKLASEYGNVTAIQDVRYAISSNTLILNCSPAPIPGIWIREGSIISSPGVPYSFDDTALRNAKVIIHDPLSIGVSTMAVMSAMISADVRESMHAGTMERASATTM